MLTYFILLLLLLLLLLFLSLKLFLSSKALLPLPPLSSSSFSPYPSSSFTSSASYPSFFSSPSSSASFSPKSNLMKSWGKSEDKNFCIFVVSFGCCSAVVLLLFCCCCAAPSYQFWIICLQKQLLHIYSTFSSLNDVHSQGQDQEQEREKSVIFSESPPSRKSLSLHRKWENQKTKNIHCF